MVRLPILRLRLGHGQPGSYELVRRISTDKCARSERSIAGEKSTRRDLFPHARSGPATGTMPLAAADEGHLGRNDGHELDIGVERESRHKNDGARNVCGIHRGLDRDRAVRLRNALLHSFRHFGRGVSNVDLTAGDVVLSAVERSHFAETGNCVL